MSARKHRSGHPRKKPLEATISSPGDINISSASRLALSLSSSTCSSPPGDGPQRIRNSDVTRLSIPKVTKKSSVKDKTLETLFVRKHAKHTPVTILNNISLCFEGHDVDSTKMKGLENIKVVSKVSVLEGSEITESESEGVGLRSSTSSLGRLQGSEVTASECLRALPSRQYSLEGSGVTSSFCLRAVPSRQYSLEGSGATESVCLRAVPSRQDSLEGSGATESVCLRTVPSRPDTLEGSGDTESVTSDLISRRGSIEGVQITKLQSGDTTCRSTTTHLNSDVITWEVDNLVTATPRVQQVESPHENENASSRGRCVGVRGRGGRRDPSLHEASRLDKKLRYLERETRRMREDLQKLSQGYTTTDAPTPRAADDLRDVRLLDEMVVTLEGQLERMSVRRWFVSNKRHQRPLAGTAGSSRDRLV